ncbi:MAG TPA: DUF3592 domain-containing protein [Pseudolysinimonas sp.]|nr:DUF3592 domain-containing protein [Pseudolysinimonas sp.]
MSTNHAVIDSLEATYDARFRDAARLIAEGREAVGVLLSRETSDRRYRGMQLVVAEFEIVDGDEPARTVTYEHIFGPATARHWRPGGRVTVWIDPANPDNIYVGR